MSDCPNTNLIPISKVVAAAIVDTREEISKVEQTYSHWAARRMKTLQRQTIKAGRRYVTLSVNQNTMTAALPTDFRKELFVGFLNEHGKKVPLLFNNALVNQQSIEDIPCEDACPKCNQSKSICNDLQVTESEKVIVIDGSPYIETTIKKLYSNGSYYLEKETPYYNTVTNTVQYATTKEYITEFDLLDCGCLNTTPKNVDKVCTYCPDVYGSYYASYHNVCDKNMGTYKIFEDTGYIQLERKFRKEKLYIEYIGFLPKLNGQLCIPEVAFETVVKGVIVDAWFANKSISVFDKQNAEYRYKVARGAMDKENGLVSLDAILQAVSLMPKFDTNYQIENDCCGTRAVVEQLENTVSEDCEINNTICNTGNGQYLAPFVLSVVAGNGEGTPVVDQNEYQNDGLIGALNLKFLIIDNNTYSLDKGDFTFDSSLGKITMLYPFQPSQVVIIPYAKLLVKGDLVDNYLSSYVLSVAVDGGIGSPVSGQPDYQHNDLIGAVNLNYLIIDNTVYSLENNDFYFDSVLGKITMMFNFQPSQFVIIPYAKTTNLN